MLVPAIVRKTELEKLFAEHLYDDDMLLYNGYPYCNSVPDLTPKENIFRWAIIDNDKVIGFFTYFIDTLSDNVCSFGLYSFDRGNPVQKHYDKICRRYGGHRAVLHEVVRDESGTYHDEYIYEIRGKKES